MRTAPASLVLLGLTTLGCLPGCAGPGPIRDRLTSMGTLKTMVGQLQFENEKLRRETTELRAENVRVSDRLAQEEAQNAELATKVDQLRGFASRDAAEPFAESSPAGAKAVPAGRATSPGRKAPFARIPGRNEPAPLLDARPESIEEPPPSRSRTNALGPESRRDPADDDSRWLPVARDPRPIKVVR